MGKIKIVQVAMVGFDGDIYTEYLDDKGRVWHQNYKQSVDPETGDRFREYYWEQRELPDEPEAEGVPF